MTLLYRYSFDDFVPEIYQVNNGKVVHAYPDDVKFIVKKKTRNSKHTIELEGRTKHDACKNRT